MREDIDILHLDTMTNNESNKDNKRRLVQFYKGEYFEANYDFDSIRRVVRVGKANKSRISKVSIRSSLGTFEDLQSLHDQAWLRSSIQPTRIHTRKEVRVVDLFSGCGALSLGIWEACRALELEMVPALAIDIQAKAIQTYARNFPRSNIYHGSVEDMLDSDINQVISKSEFNLKRRLGHIDLLLGGPPCQGHSNLNNQTRRDDPKNLLYLKMARFAEVIGPTSIIIENVPDVLHDKENVVERTTNVLLHLGYNVQSTVIDLAKIGVAQKRRRFILIASLLPLPSFSDIIAKYTVTNEHTLEWAIGDIQSIDSRSVFNTSSNISERNKERIEYLFEHDLYELPDEERPDCHRLKPHSYPSVYGRMHWENASPTLTRGFSSPGQGRFIHPRIQRTITPHEAARIQFIPDFFDFGDATRSQLQDMIGNAVPPKLSYILGLEILK